MQNFIELSAALNELSLVPYREKKTRTKALVITVRRYRADSNYILRIPIRKRTRPQLIRTAV